jgi:carboxypeptidase D
MLSLGAGFFLAAASAVFAQNSSFPHNYTGVPSGDYGPDWQTCEFASNSPSSAGFHCMNTDFQVVKPLPNVRTSLGRNWAGNIAVDCPDFPNNTLFFWAFEKENGSLTANAGERQDEPWGIWLNGGYVVFHPHSMTTNLAYVQAGVLKYDRYAPRGKTRLKG